MNWTYENKLNFVRTKGGHRRFLLEDVQPKADVKLHDVTKRRICYCRVSTASQKEDLERQANFLRIEYPNHEIIKEIGSGVNFKRKGFNSILDSAVKGNIEEIVVTHRDRLCRFGFDLVKRLVEQYSNGKIVVLYTKEESREEELVNDLVSIITVFSSRLYGLRSNSIKKKIKEGKSIEEEFRGGESIEECIETEFCREEIQDFEVPSSSDRGRKDKIKISFGAVTLVL